MLDRIFGKENFLEIIINCLKTETKGDALKMVKDYDKLSKDDKIELAYVVGLIHGIDEGIFNRKDASEFIKNIKEAYIQIGQKKVLEKLGGK